MKSNGGYDRKPYASQDDMGTNSKNPNNPGGSGLSRSFADTPLNESKREHGKSQEAALERAAGYQSGYKRG